MSLFSFFKRKFFNETEETTLIKGAETVHDSGLSDQESTGLKTDSSLKQDALKDKGKDPYKREK